MSIILDALKKSESDQQRQSGPALFEVKVAPPKARFPIWIIAIVVLLTINVLVGGSLLWRRSSRGDEAAATNTSPPRAASSPSAPAAGSPPPLAYNSPGPGYQQPYNAGPAYGQAPNGTQPPPAGYGQAPNGPPPGQSYNMPPNAAPGRNGSPPPTPYNNGQGDVNGPKNGADSRMQSSSEGNEPTLAGRSREATGADASTNPDDYAPATEPGSPLFKGHVQRGTEDGLVLYQDAALVPGANLPELRLDLHVYAAKPQDRFALINMRRVHEGDSVQAGVRVDGIVPEGVVMSHNGSKFLLPRD
jgi:general secretion pathway protein B